MVAEGEEEEEENKKRRRRGEWATSFGRDLVAGAVMGAVVHTVVAPIERAKLLLQTQEGNAAMLRRRRFKGMLDCIGRTVRDDGFLSLWRGNGTGVIRYYPSVALNFSLKVSCMYYNGVLAYEHVLKAILPKCARKCRFLVISNATGGLAPIHDLYRTMLRSSSPSEGSFLSGPASNFFAGAAAGCTTLVIIYPLDIAHTRLAADLGRSDTRQFRGICHFLQIIHQKDGIRGIYRGLPASLHGMVVHRGLYFGGFDTAKEKLMHEDHRLQLPLWQRWLIAQGVTSSAGLISYPLDTVRRRMMMQSGTNELMYHSTFDCWRKIYMREGIVSFYRGALSNMFRSTGAAAVLVLYDEVKKFMDWGGFP